MWGGVFSSNLCCFAPLNWFPADADEDDEEEVDGRAVPDALAAATADALFNCSSE